jgi:ABC-type dipeptide/oligopeptide/nickel transport system permease component
VWQERGSWAHPLGTDHLGRDFLSRLIYGARVSLSIGLTTAFTSALIGAALGMTAGYFGGRVDTAITFVIMARLAMPVILIGLAVVEPGPLGCGQPPVRGRRASDVLAEGAAEMRVTAETDLERDLGQRLVGSGEEFLCSLDPSSCVAATRGS